MLTELLINSYALGVCTRARALVVATDVLESFRVQRKVVRKKTRRHDVWQWSFTALNASLCDAAFKRCRHFPRTPAFASVASNTR